MNNAMIDEMDFNEKVKGMNDRDLLEFMAGQVYEICLICPTHTESIANHEKRLDTLETADIAQNKKLIGMAGATGGGITAIIGGALLVVLKRFGVDI